MANQYVNSVTGNDTNDGLTWATAKATTNAAAASMAAGDTMFVADVHAQSSSGTAYQLVSNAQSPAKIICTTTTANPPTATATSGKVTTTGAYGFSGWCFISGIEFTFGSTSTLASFGLNNSTATSGNQVWENCKFVSNSTGAGSAIISGGSTSALHQNVLLKNCGLSFKTNAQRMSASSQLKIEGGSLLAGSATPTTNGMFLLSSKGGTIDISGFDFSIADPALRLADMSAGCGTITFSNCKLPTGWTGSLVGPTMSSQGQRVKMINCDAADTNYKMRIEDFAGAITADTTITRFNGATDGVTPISWKMVSNANTSFPHNTLVTEEILRWYPVTDAGETLTGPKSFGVEVISDSSVNLFDDEIWVEAQVFSTSGFPLGTYISDRKSNILGTAAVQSASSELWTSSTMVAPKRQTLAVTATLQEAGWVSLKVHIAKPNTTVYVCPKVRVL